MEKNKPTIALSLLYTKEMEICSAYISKYNTCEKQISFLIIPNEKGWHYLAVKKLPALLRGKTLKKNSHFYCLNCLLSFRTENKFKCHEKVYENKDLCGIALPTQNNISKFK